jgi:hypothetical protein
MLKNKSKKGWNQWNRFLKRYKKSEKHNLILWKNKIDKLVANLTKMRKEKTQINKIRSEKGEITTNTKEI